MDYANVCGCMAHSETERWEGRKRRHRCSLSTFVLPPHLSSFCLLHLSLNSLLRALHLTVCLLFFFFSAGKYWCWSNPGGARALKEKEDNIYIWIVPPYGQSRICIIQFWTRSNRRALPNPACHLCCVPALLGKVKFAISLRVFVPSKLDPWHTDPPPPALFSYGQRQQLPQHVGGLWLGRNIPVPALHRRGDFLDRSIQCHHSDRVARKRRAGVHHCPATGAA